jgi:tetratricopeptide (TPR) repeat protein
MAEASVVCSKCGASSPFGLVKCPRCATPLGLDVTQPLGTSKPDADLAETQAIGPGLRQTGWSNPNEANAGSYETVSPGAVLGGRYEILRLLGEGGMGAVFEARDREVNRTVALKLIRPELAGNSDILRMFKQELILAQQVTHHNVLRIYDLGLVNDLRFITMQFVEGHDLKSLIQEKGKLAPAEAAAIIVQVCEGLEAAHRRKVVHRDLKPHNIMINAQGEALVMDFGLAHSAGSGGSEGTLLGTPQYMSPEQARREELDGRSDLFAIGIVFYEILTGLLPFDADNLRETLRKRINEKATPPAEIDPAIPKALSDVVMKCLATSREERYQTATEIVRDLQIWQGVLVPPTKLWKRLSLAFAALLVAAAGIGITVVLRRTAPAPKPVTLLVADFKNQTGEHVLDGTLELPFSVEMEGASFVSSYNQAQARQIARQLQPGATVMDENAARLVARREGLNVVVSGTIAKDGKEYRLSANAVDAVSGNQLAKSQVTAPTKEKLLGSLSKLARPIRKALGDRTPAASKAEEGETFTAASLEAAQDYSLAMDAQLSGKYGDAIRYFTRAVGLDPDFGRAYVGMGVIYRNLGNLEEAEKNLKIALSKMGHMSQREKYRTRGAYYVTIGSYEKGADEYKTLIDQFPADNAGHANLAICYLYLRNLPRAIEEGQKAIEIYPRNVAQRNNLASYLLYAGRFDEAVHEADEVLKMNDRFERALVVKALAALATGDADQAAGFYEQAGKISGRYRVIGLADLALFQGRAADAAALLEAGIAADLAAGQPEWAAEKQVTLAQALLLMDQRAAAAGAAEQALLSAKDVGIRFLAARALVQTGQEAKARAVARELSNQLYNEAQAYGKLIEGELALEKGDVKDAIDSMQEASKLRDAWISRFELGRAYLAGKAYTEADSEFDACIRRRGEATSLVVDLLPTYLYLPPVYYYFGRAQQGIGNPAANDSFKTFLLIKAKAGRDPLVADARKRAGQ